MCNRWFATNEDDKKIVRELLPTDETGRPLDSGLTGKTKQCIRLQHNNFDRCIFLICDITTLKSNFDPLVTCVPNDFSHSI